MKWPFSNLLWPSAEDTAARQLYRATVDQARQVKFYTDWRVPDSVTGRFDLISLHGFLVLHRLKGDAMAASFAQNYAGALFEDMDRNLREMGVGDLSVGKKVRRMAEGFFGRSAAYGKALAEDGEPLTDVLERNLYGVQEMRDTAILGAVASYVRRCVDHLAAQDIADLTAGRVSFAPLSED
jgi:cytochrome b pre-mRNA-processing protein 3